MGGEITQERLKQTKEKPQLKYLLKFTEGSADVLRENLGFSAGQPLPQHSPAILTMQVGVRQRASVLPPPAHLSALLHKRWVSLPAPPG